MVGDGATNPLAFVAPVTAAARTGDPRPPLRATPPGTKLIPSVYPQTSAVVSVQALEKK